MKLSVRLNDQLLLDAGTTEELSASELVIHPPPTTLFRQVLDYLRRQPDPPTPSRRPTDDYEGPAAAAVALRWGSYFAVLADRTKPVWAETRSPEASRISDHEMARINIEASAALAEWIDISREDPIQYEQLAVRALAYLPMPKVRTTPAGSGFAMLATAEVAAKLLAVVAPARLARAQDEAARHPSRIIANALVNTAWRNGPVERIHGGRFRGYPLDRRRVTAAEERTLFAFALDRLTTGMDVCQQLARERGRSWSEQVVPYGLAEILLITPSDWTLTEATRAVRLRRS